MYEVIAAHSKRLSHHCQIIGVKSTEIQLSKVTEKNYDIFFKKINSKLVVITKLRFRSLS